MRALYTLPLRVRSLFRKQETEQDLHDEFQFHLQSLIDENVAKGMSPEEARRAALRAMGGVEKLKEECREMRNVNWIENFLQDLRFGLRMLRRSPGFSTLAILCLTVGIGANAAAFSWIEGILFRPYPGVTNQDRLRTFVATQRGKPGYDEMSWPDLLDYQRNSTLLAAVIGEKITGARLSIGDRAEPAVGSMVSANYFDAMGVRPFMGRYFQPGEDVGRNSHPVVVISYQLWKDKFQGDSQIVGKTQVMNSLPHTIVGVAPEGFYGTFVGYAFQFWVPMSMQALYGGGTYKLEDRGEVFLEPFVLLKPGVSDEQAQAELSAIAGRLENDFPGTNRGRGARILPLWQAPFNNAQTLRPTLTIALGVACLVLLIACANVGNLLLVRALARRHEMTVRLSLGAGRGRLLTQLLTEGLILASIAMAGGLLIAYWSRNLLLYVIPPRGISMRIAGDLDWRVLGLSAAVSLVSVLLFALVPAVHTSNVDLAGALKSDSGTVAGGRGRGWVRSGLVLVQVSLSFLLLVGAALLLMSVQKVRSANPGFEVDGLLMTTVNVSAAGYDEQRGRNFHDRLMDRVQTLSGVQSAAYGRGSPFSFLGFSSSQIAMDGYQTAPDQQLTAEYNEVSPGYFATLGIPLVTGRDFTRADDQSALPVAIVGETMAAKFWPGQDVVGKRLQVKGQWRQIVGVVKDIKYGSLMEAAKPFFYVPLRQSYAPYIFLFVRTPLGTETMAKAVGAEVRAIDPELPRYGVLTMRELMSRTTTAQHAAVSLLSAFGLLALFLAAIGLYGVMSYAVSQSTRELAVRVALGAAPSNLLQMVLSHGLVLTGIGIAVGAAVALGTTRLLGYLLYKVGPRDPLAFGSALGVMIVVALVACLMPAWRAARINPVITLRAQ